jgi:hypothetical protein
VGRLDTRAGSPQRQKTPSCAASRQHPTPVKLAQIERMRTVAAASDRNAAFPNVSDLIADSALKGLGHPWPLLQALT